MNENIGPKYYGSWLCNNNEIGIIILEKWDSSLEKIDTLNIKEQIKKIENIIDNTDDVLVKEELIKKYNKMIKKLDELKDVNQCTLNYYILNMLINKINKLHELGYIHGDLHEGNILIKMDNTTGNVDNITISDFGKTILENKNTNNRISKKNDNIIIKEIIKCNKNIKNIDKKELILKLIN